MEKRKIFSFIPSSSWQLYDFALKHPGRYQDSIKVAGQFYASSGFQVYVWILEHFFKAFLAFSNMVWYTG